MPSRQLYAAGQPFIFRTNRSMKAKIRKVVRKIALWPVVGRFVRIGVAVIRLPEFRAEYLARGQSAPISHSTSQLLANLDHRALFESQQLPTLLQALADVNHRQLSSDNDRDNLVQSVPVALRTIARDLHQLQAQLGKLDQDMSKASQEADTAKEELRKASKAADTARLDLDAVKQELASAKQELGAAQQELGVMKQDLAGTKQDLTELRGRADSTDAVIATERQALSATRGDIETAAAGLREQEERGAALGRQFDEASQALARLEAEARGDIATVKESVGYLLGRVEFVRREVMFEMRYGASSPAGGEESLKADTRVLSGDKLEAARRDGLRLNLGCGHIALDGYLNVDRRALPGVDIVAEVDQLPFGSSEVDEIFSAHLLEHFPQEQLMRQLLPYYHGLLKQGGRFHAVVPDAEAMISAYSDGGYPYDDLREVIYGGQDYDGDFHFNMFTPASLSQLLLDAGFANPTVIASGRKNGRCYEFEISAEKQ